MKNRPFGLSELVIILAIVGILYKVAYSFSGEPIFDSFLLRSSVGSFAIAALFMIFTWLEIKSYLKESAGFASKASSVFRILLFLCATAFLMYVGIAGE